MKNNITDKVIVITGASSGLGEASARLLSSEGASVVLGARRRDRIQALADELTNRGGKALAVATRQRSSRLEIVAGPLFFLPSNNGIYRDQTAPG